MITFSLWFQDCIICMDRLSCPSDYDVASEGAQSIQPGAVGKFKCGHTLHMLCMLAMYNNGTKVGATEILNVIQLVAWKTRPHILSYIEALTYYKPYKAL